MGWWWLRGQEVEFVRAVKTKKKQVIFFFPKKKNSEKKKEREETLSLLT